MFGFCPNVDKDDNLFDNQDDVKLNSVSKHGS